MIPRDGPKNGNENEASDSRADAEIARYNEAESVLIDLQDALNQELRGRRSQDSHARIDTFLSNDPIYHELEPYYALLKQDAPDAAAEFRETVRRTLGVFERLAEKNPDIDAAGRLGPYTKHAYRILAVKVFNEKTGLEPADPESLSIFKLAPLARAREPEESSRQSQAQETAAVAIPPTPAEAARGDRETEPATTPELDDKIIDELTTYLRGFMGSITRQAELHEMLSGVAERPENDCVRQLITEALPPSERLWKHLEAISGLVHDLRSLERANHLSVFDGSDLYLRIQSVRESWGLAALDNPLLELVDEGVLRPDIAARINGDHEIVSQVTPAVLGLAKGIPSSHSLSAAQLRSLAEAHTHLRLAGLDERDIDSKMLTTLQHGPEKIAHLLNLSKLASHRVSISDLFTISREAEGVLASAARGEYDTVPISNSRYPKLVRRAIESHLRVVREPRSELREALQSTMDALPPDPLVDRIALQDSLHQIGSRMRPAEVSANLLQVAENLTALRRSGIHFQKFADMFTDDSHELSSTQLLGYLADLAALQRQGIEGVATLFAHSEHVWNARRMGDETQNIIGFTVEANVALKLQANGYRLLGLSRTLASGFEYDIVAQSPQGTAVGIEVKRSLATILGKNQGVWDRDALRSTQLWRHCAAAIEDKLTPVIAVSSGGIDNWSSDAVGHMIQAVADQLKVRPVVINGLTGARIRI